MLTRLIALVIVCGFAASSLIAQARPDFSGKWNLVVAADAPLDARTTMTVSQDAATLNGELNAPAGRQTWSLKLDGTESKNRTVDNREVVSTVKWDSSRLVISTPLPRTADGEFTLVQTWSLEDGKLVIRSSQINLASGTPTPTRTVIQTYTR